jgi:hypothetical protein
MQRAMENGSRSFARCEIAYPKTPINLAEVGRGQTARVSSPMKGFDMRALVTVLCLIATPAVAADQFDLTCKGRERPTAMSKWRPYEVRYRVDTSAKIYCRFTCEATETITSVDGAKIVFAKGEQRAGASTIIHYVDRTDGKWVYFISGMADAEGVCEVAPFSGFPNPKF